MNYQKLGNTKLDVSTICLGTMTWGEQNTQEEGFEQMDYTLFLQEKKRLEVQKKLLVIGLKKIKRETK